MEPLHLADNKNLLLKWEQDIMWNYLEGLDKLIGNSGYQKYRLFLKEQKVREMLR